MVIVDHDIQVLRQADWLIEIGPGSGRGGGTVIAEGTLRQITHTKASRSGGYLTDREDLLVRRHALAPGSPRGRLTAVTIATYSGVLDDLRRAYAATPAAKERGLKDRTRRPVPAQRRHHLPRL
ncbi:hypothetical protein [Streptomyces himastatinicus]|uniref:hypothetical protein n=1 Tax=Streptomyces himastatinicus TaxID=998084 RepID=UPI0001B4C87B|nr:hypothetical protein [Streptomyces himastatinicus]